ncbi:Transcriptional regulator, LysR family [Bradyrhizobium sp. STM 3843]|uniref:LysR family transcriptional regulator n=1 Tax=Bradyrhizobium sp. STM 3843 TaxID=551947 RepID=UPI0002405014|nr:LysR family transcriptional regulator [Bradyrhizobium sp. STM 3843]CCE10547.1 Transcriptional regulator, LysR family [Bradyrhizobium sp. STM 3843]
MAIRRVDLNLFRVFEAIMRHRSVAGAARELNITPSAVSHALARLRQLLDDQLFILAETGMTPTARALELAPDINEGLRRFAEAVTSRSFDPLRSARTFRIAMSDYAGMTLLPLIADKVGKMGPNINLRIFPLSRLDLVANLDSGQVEMAVGWFGNLPRRMRRMPVLAESEALVVRVGHPLTASEITMERLFAFPHVVVELTGSEARPADGFIEEQGVERRVWIERLLLEQENDRNGLVGRVAISLPHYSAVANLVGRSDMVATLPRSIAIREAARESLVILELPYDPLQVMVETVWHERANQDPGLQWFFDEILPAAAADLKMATADHAEGPAEPVPRT